MILPVALYAAGYAVFSAHPGAVQLDQILDEAMKMYRFHTSFPEGNPYNSQYWQWPWLTRPVALFAQYGLAAGRESRDFMMGNPLVHWFILPAVLACIVRRSSRRNLGLGYVIAFFFANYLPWVAVGRSTYLYHFAPIAPFGIIALAWCVAELRGRKPKIFAIYAAGVIAVFFWFLPVATGMEMPSGYFSSVSWFHGWFKLDDPTTSFTQADPRDQN